jgi:hypothetical protein
LVAARLAWAARLAGVAAAPGERAVCARTRPAIFRTRGRFVRADREKRAAAWRCSRTKASADGQDTSRVISVASCKRKCRQGCPRRHLPLPCAGGCWNAASHSPHALDAHPPFSMGAVPCSANSGQRSPIWKSLTGRRCRSSSIADLIGEIHGSVCQPPVML